MNRKVAIVFPKLHSALKQILQKIPLKGVAVPFALGLLAFLISQFDEVSRAQTGGCDRAQYVDDKPVGGLEGQLPEAGEVDVMIELNQVPTSRVYAQALGNKNDRTADALQRAQARGAARAQMARIKGEQQRVLAALGIHGRKARVLYSVQTAYNGIAAKVDASIIPELRGHADVKGVYALPIHYLENSSSLPFIKAASAWVATGGNA